MTDEEQNNLWVYIIFKYLESIRDTSQVESEKINCETTKCENCQNHNYCDFEPHKSEGERMTREDAIKIFNTVLLLGKCDCSKKEIEECLKMAIKALEREPCCKCIEFKRYAKEMGFEIDQEQYKADLQSAYDCGKASVKPCEDTISRADAVKVASGYCHPSNIAKELAKLPPVTPKPETAHWIKVPGEETFFCSKCNCRLDDEQTYLPLNFCPNCGRKMVDPQESEV